MQHLFFLSTYKKGFLHLHVFFLHRPATFDWRREIMCVPYGSPGFAGPGGAREVDREVQVSETRRMGRSYDRVEW